MKKYLKTTGIFFGVWFIASVFNGLLCGISLGLLEPRLTAGIFLIVLFSIMFSFLFSAPMVAVVWFAAIVAQLADMKGNALLQFVLGFALVCSILGALIFVYTLGSEFSNTKYITGLCIIFSALISVLLFRKKIKTNE